MLYLIIVGIFSLVGAVVNGTLKNKFRKYAQIPMKNGLAGVEVASYMLKHYGINDVRVQEGKGFLTDHYNPKTKIITLSPDVFRGRHVAATAVAAHECGHAVQHAQAYGALQLRTKLVPLIHASAKIQKFLIIGFIIGMSLPGLVGDTMLLALTVTFFMTALFSLVTLPVEFDASRRALAFIEGSGIATSDELQGAKDSLWWAAMTYVANAMSALIMFLFFLLSYMGKRNMPRA